MDKGNEVVKLIREIREKGKHVAVEKPIAHEVKLEIMAAILYLLSDMVILTLELVRKGSELMGVVVATESKTIENWKKKLDKTYADDDEVFFIEKEYGNRDAEKLLGKLGLQQEYLDYRENSIPDSRNGLARVDVEKQKEAERLFDILHPSIDKRGHLLLAEDGEGNSAWAYAMRNNAGGKLSYGIYRMDSNGGVSTSTIVSPSAVNGMTMKIGNTVADYDGKFTSQAGIQATQRLWLWNISRKFKPVKFMDDYTPTEVFEVLKDWIYKNVEVTYQQGNGESANLRKPVFIAKTKGRIDIGIWVDDLEFVFDRLDIKTLTPRAWITEALKEEYVVPVFSKTKDGEETKRAGYNPYKANRDECGRSNKHERVYRIAFSEEETKKVWEKYEEICARRKQKEIEKGLPKVETDLSKKVETGGKDDEKTGTIPGK